MLLDITLTNFRSVKQTQTVSFEAVTDKSLDQKQLIKVDENFDLIRISAILGPNGSGKSAVLRAVESVRSFVLAGDDDAFSGAGAGSGAGIVGGQQEGEEQGGGSGNPLDVLIGSSFAYDREWASKPSKITLRMVVGNDAETGLAKIYVYTLEADREIVHRERLYLEVGRSTRRMFDRILQKDKNGKNAASSAEPAYVFYWGKKYEGDKKKLGKKIPANRSFLQAAALAGSRSALPAYQWFRDFLTIIPLGLSSLSEQLIISKLQKKPSWRRNIVDFLWSMDLMDIRDIRITERGTKRLIYIHGAGDSRFATYFTSESLGVRRLTLIALTFMEAFLHNKTVVSDDFSLFLHPAVTRHLIKIFIRGTRSSESQLLISGVDPTLLDDTLIRRDGIWFTTRGRQDGSIFYSLSDYKYRQKHDVSDMYRLGAFGALPILSEFVFDRKEGGSVRK